jgi:hypothetical protein
MDGWTEERIERTEGSERRNGRKEWKDTKEGYIYNIYIYIYIYIYTVKWRKVLGEISPNLIYKDSNNLLGGKIHFNTMPSPREG